MYRFGNVFNFRTKSKIKAGAGNAEGKYPFYTSSTELNKYVGEYLFDGQSLVFGTGGIASVHFAQNKFAVSTDCLVAHTNKEDINPKFVYYYLSGNMHVLEQGFKGAGLKHISKTYISDIVFPNFIRSKQDQIVQILDIANSLRQKRNQQIDLIDDFLKSTFIDMFGDPVKNEKSWEIISLSHKILDVKNGITRRRKEMLNEGNIVLRLRDIRENKIDFRELNRIKLDNNEKNKFNVEIGDLLFIRVNGNPEYVGRSAVFNGYNEEVFFNDHIMRVKIDKCEVNVVFLCFLLNSSYGKRQIALYKKTSAGQHTINQEGLGKIRCYLPPIELQNKFAQIVKQEERIKQKMQKSVDEMDNLFDALMQKAFKGDL
ncbi:MAG: restriction endonuclease subunit S [Candidatus Omnitrophica bacterium]|nr:restriction endonuclease subunit S [Candidatus Omnitrophota bacterium]